MCRATQHCTAMHCTAFGVNRPLFGWREGSSASKRCLTVIPRPTDSLLEQVEEDNTMDNWLTQKTTAKRSWWYWKIVYIHSVLCTVMHVMPCCVGWLSDSSCVVFVSVGLSRRPFHTSPTSPPPRCTSEWKSMPTGRLHMHIVTSQSSHIHTATVATGRFYALWAGDVAQKLAKSVNIKQDRGRSHII